MINVKWSSENIFYNFFFSKAQYCQYCQYWGNIFYNFLFFKAHLQLCPFLKDRRALQRDCAQRLNLGQADLLVRIFSQIFHLSQNIYYNTNHPVSFTIYLLSSKINWREAFVLFGISPSSKITLMKRYWYVSFIFISRSAFMRLFWDVISESLLWTSFKWKNYNKIFRGLVKVYPKQSCGHKNITNSEP